MQNSFQRDLVELKKGILVMGSMVEEAVTKAMSSLVNRKDDTLNEIIAGDKLIDAQENAIDQACEQILALNRPVARDLRMIMTIMKINDELERMGDHAKNIAKASRVLVSHDPLPIYQDLFELSKRTLAQVSSSLDALMDMSSETAEEVRESDKEIDTICSELEDRIEEIMRANPSFVAPGLKLFRVLKNIERIADISKNIAKDVIFLVEGDQVRHGGRIKPLI